MLRKPVASSEAVAERLSPAIATRRFGPNMISNVGYLVLSTVLMLWYVPFLIDHLGIAAYGVLPLANSLVMFTFILSSSLDVSINRFLAIDLNRGDIGSANRTFNTALAMALLACAALLVPGLALVWLFPVAFEVPAGLEGEARLLLASTLLTTLAAMISANFAASSLVLHRFDLRNVVRILSLLARTGLVALLFALLPPSLWQVALGFAVAAMVGLLGDVLVWRHLTPQLSVSPASAQRTRMRELAGLSGWSVVNQAGILLLMQADLVLVNTMFGAAVTGVYGSILLFPQLIHTLNETATSILSPTVMGHYARNDLAGLRDFAARAVRLLGLALALPVGLLCGLGAVLLDAWLGPEFRAYHPLLIILVAHLVLNLATRPLSYVLTAHNRVRVQGLATVGFGALNVALSIGLGWGAGLGVMGVAIAFATVYTLRSVAFLAGYTAHVMQLPWLTFLRPLFAGAVACAAVACLGLATVRLLSPEGWLGLIVAATPISLAYLAVVYRFLLSADERRLILSQLPTAARQG